MSSLSSLSVLRVNTQSLSLLFACAALTALGARIAFFLPFTPVPATWQVAAVLLTGLTLGARSAFTAQALYLLTGLAGAPVFAFGNGGAAYLFNSFGTGGYLLSYPLAACVVALLIERSRPENRIAPLFACGAGLMTIYGLGCLWLGLWLHLSPLETLLKGAGWFVIWDMAKAILIILIVYGLKHRRGQS